MELEGGRRRVEGEGVGGGVEFEFRGAARRGRGRGWEDTLLCWFGRIPLYLCFEGVYTPRVRIHILVCKHGSFKQHPASTLASASTRWPLGDVGICECSQIESATHGTSFDAHASLSLPCHGSRLALSKVKRVSETRAELKGGGKVLVRCLYIVSHNLSILFLSICTWSRTLLHGDCREEVSGREFGAEQDESLKTRTVVLLLPC